MCFLDGTGVVCPIFKTLITGSVYFGEHERVKYKMTFVCSLADHLFICSDNS